MQHTRWRLLHVAVALVAWPPLAASKRLGRHRDGSGSSSSISPTPSFADYYETHVGRGIWKWNVALDAYQRHFGSFATREARVMEIGVQSGGSINMFETVFPKCHYYGVDINKNCLKFEDQRTTIYIGDQASVPSWSQFFSSVSSYVDIAIDDGGHQAHQMLTTIQQLLPRVSPGGFYCTEDIHGQNDDYLTKFLQPAADVIADLASSKDARVESVHLYPFMLGVQMSGGQRVQLPPPDQTVTNLDELSAALPNHRGGAVAVVNPNWGSMLASEGLRNIMGYFYGIYGGVVREEPPQCHGTMSNECTMIVTNTPQQNVVKAIHVFPRQLLLEVHAQPPVIAARRRGSQWIPYAAR